MNDNKKESPLRFLLPLISSLFMLVGVLSITRHVDSTLESAANMAVGFYMFYAAFNLIPIYEK